MRSSGRLLAVLAVLGIVVIAGGLAVSRLSAAGPPVETAPVTRGTIETTVELAGTVEAVDERALTFASPGTVATVAVEPGDAVAADAVLATLETTTLEAQLAAAEAALAGAEARLADDQAGPTAARRAAARDGIAQAEQTLANAKRAQSDAKAQADLAVRQAGEILDDADARLAADQAAGAPATVIAADEAAVAVAERALESARAARTTALDQAAGTVASASKAVTAARNSYAVVVEPAPAALIAADVAAIAQAEAQVVAAQAALDAATLRSPIAGVVTVVGLRVGDRVGTGVPASGSIVVATVDDLRVEATASEIDVVSLETGQPVAVGVDALPDAAIEGTLCEIAPTGTRIQGVTDYPVTICLTTGTAGLRVGMTANGSVVLERREDVLLVPVQAITTVEGRSTVEVLESDGSIVEVEVTVGLSSGTRTEIVSGLSEGQAVVLPSTDPR
jgi:multidrug efflux pump subunit AcrA (membrane-fusion protein)